MNTRERARLYLSNPAQMQLLLVSIQDLIDRGVRDRPQYFLQELVQTRSGKNLIGADLFAEDAIAEEMQKNFPNDISVEGEESLAMQELDLTDSDKVHLLCDIIDGTDLMVRDFSNWCSALVAFEPREKNVLSAYVLCPGSRSSKLYSYVGARQSVTVTEFAKVIVAGDDGRISTKKIYELDAPHITSQRSLNEASICGYAQKFSRLQHLSELVLSPSANTKLANMKSARFYNLAGNPMMCRMLDGAVDIVFDLAGQAPHDVVPGALIALACGATMFDLSDAPIRSDRKIEIDDLSKSLLRPASPEFKLKYCLSANEALGREFLAFCGVK